MFTKYMFNPFFLRCLSDDNKFYNELPDANFYYENNDAPFYYTIFKSTIDYLNFNNDPLPTCGTYNKIIFKRVKCYYNISKKLIYYWFEWRRV